MRHVKFGLLLNLFVTLCLGVSPVEPIPGEIYLKTLMQLLDGASETSDSIDILHFTFFTENGETRKIAEKLKTLKANNPGLRIRILLEGEKDSNKPKGAATRNRLTKKFFDGTGIEVFLISGLKAPQVSGVTHAKAIRVGNTILSGSTNLTNTSLTKNNEFNLKVTSKRLADKLTQFVDLLVKDSSRLYSINDTDNRTTLLTDDLFLAEAIRLVDTVQKGESLDIFNYFFRVTKPGDEKAKELFDRVVAAQVRGAVIRVFLERSNNEDLNNEITESNLNVARLLNENEIKLIYFDPEEKISHSKIIRYVGKTQKAVLLGSTNLYRGDISENHQVNFLVTDMEFVDQLGSYLNQKIAYNGTPFHTLESGKPAPRMYRLWRGYKQDGVEGKEFSSKVNALLIPETIAVGSQRGLLAYLPFLPSESKPALLPDELALLVYETEEAYNAIRTTPRGAKYGPLHFEPGLFAKETELGHKSGSLVSFPFEGTVKIDPKSPEKIFEAAYQIGLDTDWQSCSATAQILLPESGLSNDLVETHLQDIASQVKSGKSLKGAIIAVQEHFLVNVLCYKTDKNRRAKAVEGMELFETIPMPAVIAGKKEVTFSGGGNVQFEQRLLEHSKLIEPIIDEMQK